MRTRNLALAVLVISVAMASCQPREADRSDALHATGRAGTMQSAVPAPVRIAQGEILFVPAYSRIFSQDERRTFPLTVTLSIRNTDLTSPITVTSVRYYDTEGRIVTNYAEQPLRLAPLASTSFVVREKNTAGGVGANFIVEWVAEKSVTEPVVEAVMIGTGGQQGISFTSPARVIGYHTPSSSGDGEP